MRKTTSIFFVGTCALAAGMLAVTEREARACGGCFSPPTETDSVVTDHRMILSVSSQQTTLYDQIHYTGKPSSFAWVLPINGQAVVGISSDVVFDALDSLSQTQVQQPPTRCPTLPSDCQNGALGGSFTGGADGGSAPAPPGDVNVIKEQVVGPYETVQLSATTPQALENWLSAHGYNVAADAKAIIDAYQNEHYDFLAMKLVPGADVASMRPVRVTTPGGSPVLPLRMVTAGTGPQVGITLWVLADGRYEPQNFGSFQLTSEQITWDWASSSSNYKDLRAQKSDGKTWEIESSTQTTRDFIQTRIFYPYYGGPGGGGFTPPFTNGDASSDYLPVDGVDGGAASESPGEVRDDDMKTLFAGLSQGNVRLTRMRADLAHASLNTDLNLQAAADQSELATLRIPTQESGQPTCTIYNGCDVVGQGPRDQAIASANQSSGSKESFSCDASATSRRAKVPIALLAVGAFLGIALARSRRKRS